MTSRALPGTVWMMLGMVMVGGGDRTALARPESAAEASSIQSIFSHANDQYRQSHYAEAIQGYQAICERGVESGPLYYNLGNALLKSGRTSEALWAYLNAKRLMPRDPDLAANLSYARSLHAVAEGVSLSLPRAIRWLSLRNAFSSEELSTALVWLLWMVAALWVLVGWMPRARAFTRPVVWCASLVATVVLTALIVQTVWVDGVPTAVTVLQGVEVKFAPQESGTLHFALPQGAIVRVLGRQFGWVQVARGDGKSGWVKEDALKAL